MNLKNNIKSKQIQTVRHNPDKDSVSLFSQWAVSKKNNNGFYLKMWNSLYGG